MVAVSKFAAAGRRKKAAAAAASAAGPNGGSGSGPTATPTAARNPRFAHLTNGGEEKTGSLTGQEKMDEIRSGKFFPR